MRCGAEDKVNEVAEAKRKLPCRVYRWLDSRWIDICACAFVCFFSFSRRICSDYDKLGT